MRLRLRFMCGTALLLCAAPLLAMGGGGGGGSSMPSASAPQYDPVAEYQRGVAALQANDFKTAKIAFDHVIAAAPRDANAQYLGGMARSGLGDLKGARKFFERATKLAPDNIRAWRELGVTLNRLGDAAGREKVLAVLRARAATCGTTCPQAAELAAALKAVESAPGATSMDDLRRSPLLAGADRGDSAYLDAVSLINQGQYEAAISSLDASRSSFGPHPDILTYLGFANRKLGRFAEAERFYRSALAVAPHHRGATEYYGELMVERGDLKGARAMLARLEAQCRFGCAESEELRLWIAAGHSPHS